MKKILKVYLVLIALFAVTFSGYSQVTTSGMSGKITSVNNEPLPGASVVAVHQPSGTQYGTITNSEGRFNIQGMRSGGPYQVEVSFVGYNKATYADITLFLGESFVLNVNLQENNVEVGEVIVVGSKPSAFGTNKTGASTNISNDQMTLLPSINRSLGDFTRLSPYSGAGGSFGGRDGRLNNVTIDGANFNNNFGLSSSLPGGGNPISLDAIDELQVTIAPFDVKQANFVGAGINAITKSGNNTFKGGVYTFQRNQNYRGNTVDGYDLGDRPKESTATYGFTLGGPIIKNKLFFFVNGEYENSPQPIQQWKLSTDGVANADQNITRVTASDMEAFKTALDKYGYDPGSYTNYDGGSLNKKMLARIDWNINDNNKFTVRYNYTKNVADIPTNATSTAATKLTSGRISQNAMAFRNNAYSMDNLVHSLTAELNTRISNNMSNQLLGTFTRIEDVRGSLSSPFPHIDIMKDGDAFMSAGYELFSWNNGVKNNITSIIDNLTYSIGEHTITAGVSYEDQYVSNSFQRFGTGYYRFKSLADFASGAKPESWGLTYGYGGELNPVADLRFGQASIYAQDEWNINKNFKLTYGIRGDLTSYLNDLVENTEVSKLTFLDNRKINTGMWPTSKLLLSPRVGFSYDVRGDKSLKVRGGTGIFTGRIPLVFFTNMPTNGGMVQNTVTRSGSSADLAKLIQGGKIITDVNQMVSALGLPTVATAALPSSIAAVDPDFKLPQVWKSSLAMDYQIPASFPMALTLEGMYSKDINSVCQVYANMPDPATAGFARFNGPDKRYIYTSKIINAGVNDAMVLKNTNKGYGYNLNATITAEPVENLKMMLAYTYTKVKEISGNPGSQANSAWQNQASIDGPNQLGLQNSQYVTPNKVIASISYRKVYAKHFATNVGLYYGGYNTGSYSWIYSSDMNKDGVNNDLMYIPASQNEILFKEGANGFTAAQQAEAFWKFIEQDPYLSKNKGKYAEAYSAKMPWVNRFDLKLAQDFRVKAGSSLNTLQISLDILNFGNLINNSWGVTQTSAPSNYGKVLKYESIDASKTPIYSMYYTTVDGVKKLPTKSFSVYNNQSNTWQLQLGIRYIFN
ncbi:MAG: carboxypeptidase regulatory-like domain-containing protein [Bacteroidota bacterium]|nr:carboxypeptidase regulatory-like domain-containing protein [Bacteroidota bacterium]